MKTKPNQAQHTHEYKRSKPSASVETCYCGSFKHTENAGLAIKGYPASEYCLKCRWVHESDSVSGTSFQGVGLCPIHAAAPELLEVVKAVLDDPRSNELWPHIQDALRSAIAKAEGRE